MGAPAPYITRRIGSAELVALPDALEWTARALATHGALHAFAATQPGRAVLRGRGVVYRISVGGNNVVVRHYHRGGAARMLADRYLRVGASRPEREVKASITARERGIPTPRVIASAVYPSGIFYRADLVTEEIPAAADLAAILFGGGASAEARRAACDAAAQLIADTARAGLLHRDANAMNILIETPETRPRAHLLDLDGARVMSAGDAGALQRAMSERLIRSLRKLQGQTRALGGEELSALTAVISGAA